MKWKLVSGSDDAVWRGLVDKWVYVRPVDESGAFDAAIKSQPTEVRMDYPTDFRWNLEGLPWSEWSGIRSTWHNFGSVRLSPYAFNYYASVVAATREARVTVTKAGCPPFTTIVQDRLTQLPAPITASESLASFIERELTGKVDFKARESLSQRGQEQIGQLQATAKNPPNPKGVRIPRLGGSIGGNGVTFMLDIFPAWQTRDCAVAESSEDAQSSWLRVTKFPCTINVVAMIGQTRGEASPLLDKGFNFIEFASVEIPLSAAPVPSRTKPGVSKIKCVKGKQSKVVSGTNPKCPKGFRKA